MTADMPAEITHFRPDSARRPAAAAQTGRIATKPAAELMPFPRRKPGLYTRSGAVVLEGIQQEQVQALARQERKVGYIGVQSVMEEPLKLYADMNHRGGPLTLPRDLATMYEDLHYPGLGSNMFRQFVIPHVTERLRSIMHDKHMPLLAIRGAVISVNGPINAHIGYWGKPRLALYRRIFDARAIAGVGVDEPSVERDFQPFGHDEVQRQEWNAINTQTTDWLVAEARQSREELAHRHPYKASAVYPAILAYDGDRFLTGIQYGAHLLPGTNLPNALAWIGILPYPGD